MSDQDEAVIPHTAQAKGRGMLRARSGHRIRNKRIKLQLEEMFTEYRKQAVTLLSVSRLVAVFYFGVVSSPNYLSPQTLFTQTSSLKKIAGRKLRRGGNDGWV